MIIFMIIRIIDHDHDHNHHLIPCEQCSCESKDNSNKETTPDHSEERENAKEDLKVMMTMMMMRKDRIFPKKIKKEL